MYWERGLTHLFPMHPYWFITDRKLGAEKYTTKYLHLILVNIIFFFTNLSEGTF